MKRPGEPVLSFGGFPGRRVLFGEKTMTWIQTFTGRKFSLTDPQPEDVCIEDIAHALANVCRFGGHCRGHYSVAQHSVHVADIVAEDFKLDAILHDAGEAYYGDITRPQKILLRGMTTRIGGICDFQIFIDRIDCAIAEHFGIPSTLPQAVCHADTVMLATEARDLLTEPPLPWEPLPCPLPHTVTPWPRDESYAQFVRIFRENER